MATLTQKKINQSISFQTEREFLRDNWDTMTVYERMVLIRLFNAIDTLKSENDFLKQMIQNDF
jgi:hypothetical protein